MSETTKIKHALIIKEMVENGSTAKAAIKKAGYSDAVSIAPTKITRTKSFQELLQKYLPENHVLKKHRQLLDKKDRKTKEIDTQAVGKALELAYKIGGRFGPTLPPGDGELILRWHNPPQKDESVND